MNSQIPIRGRPLLEAGRPIPTHKGWWQQAFSTRFESMVDRIDAALEFGTVEGHLPDGSIRILGGRGPGPYAVCAIQNWMPMMRLWVSGSVGWYQSWAAGEWTSPDPVQIFDIFMRNRRTLGETGRAHGLARLAKRLTHAFRRNSRAGARRNIHDHYDLGNDFYAAWLDQSMTYSAGIFADASDSLADAQAHKVRLLLDRLDLKPGQNLLEIGCGWGALAEIAARDYGVCVTGHTLSREQQLYAEERARIAGLADKISIRLTDYRDIAGIFDAVVSVEMVEAVGQGYWPAYLQTIQRVLKPGGKAAIQYIAIDDTIFEAYSKSADFIQTYIFPGGMLLSESRFRNIAEGKGLDWHPERRFGLDYAETLKRWRLRFDDAIVAGQLPQGFDQRFIDLWRYYLMYCEGGFRGGGIDVAHVTLKKRG